MFFEYKWSKILLIKAEKAAGPMEYHRIFYKFLIADFQ